jgi:hypothetical protein
MSNNPIETPTAPAPPANRWTARRITMISAGVLTGLLLLIFLTGVLLALLSNVEATAPRVQIIRDVFIIILALQGILVIAALAILIVQIARLINLLQNEIMPILKNTQETVNTTRGTVEFVGSNVVEPVIKLNSFVAALIIIIRELFGIRRALRREPHDDKQSS